MIAPRCDGCGQESAACHGEILDEKYVQACRQCCSVLHCVCHPIGPQCEGNGCCLRPQDPGDALAKVFSWTALAVQA